MELNSYSRRFTFYILVLFLFAGPVYAQQASFPAPKQEKLLNGLKLLMWSQPNADKVSVKLRIHSGSAFDPQDKEGVMALLADTLFPNEQIKEFFAEDLGGSLEIVSNYDYIQINATGKNDQVLTILETIAAAVSNPVIDKETTARVKNARLEKIKEWQKNPKHIADQAARQRLLGDFPYGRAQAGTEESLAKIDFADLLFAQERFLTADNATLTVTGNFKNDLIYRAVRRYFGGWRKSGQRIPATFAEAAAPDEKPFSVKSQYAENSQVRYALRGLARNDRDFYASQILTKILQNRLESQIPRDYGAEVFVRQEEHILPGIIVFGYTSQPKPVVAAPVNPAQGKNENIVTLILKNPVTAEEFNRAKTEFLNEFNQTNAAEFWLDAETYKLTSVKDETAKVGSVTAADVNRVAERLRKMPVVAVSILKAGEDTAEIPKNF